MLSHTFLTPVLLSKTVLDRNKEKDFVQPQLDQRCMLQDTFLNPVVLSKTAVENLCKIRVVHCRVHS